MERNYCNRLLLHKLDNRFFIKLNRIMSTALIAQHLIVVIIALTTATYCNYNQLLLHKKGH